MEIDAPTQTRSHTKDVTVVMPFTDRLKYFEAYHAAGHWDGLPLQLVCDGSEPSTVARLQSLTANEGRARVHAETARLGVAATRALGAQLVETPYCVFCDDDDFLVDAGEALSEAAVQLTHESVLFSALPFVFRHGEKSAYGIQYDRSICHGMTGRRLLKEMLFSGEMLALGAGTVFRTEAVVRAAAEPIFEVGEDFVSVARIAAAHPDRRVSVLSEGAYMRLVHDGAVTKQRSEAHVMQHLASLFVAAHPLLKDGHITAAQLRDVLLKRGNVLEVSWGRGRSAAAYFAASIGGGTAYGTDAESAATRAWLEATWSRLPDECRTLLGGNSGELAGKKLPTPITKTNPSEDRMMAPHDIAPAPFMDAHEASALTACLKAFDRPIRALEWGSGTSTRYFSEQLSPGSTWDSVEHHREWAQTVYAQLAEANLPGTTVHLVANNGPFTDGIEDGDYNDFRDYVRFPSRLAAPFDFILVDGRARVECLRHAWSLVSESGVVVLHDAQREEYHVGLPTDGWLVRMTNPDVNHGEGSSTIFWVGKSREHMAALANTLASAVPLQIDGPLPAAQFRQTRALEGPHGVFLNTFHRGFLVEQYQANPGLASAPYAEQHAALQATCFGDSDFYSAGLRAAGWTTQDLIINADPVQAAWAREHGFSGDLQAIAIEQIKRLRPDMVYIQDMNHVSRDFLFRLRPWTRLLVGQIATSVVTDIPFEKYDVVLSSFPHYVDEIRQGGVTAYYQPLAFDARILKQLPNRSYAERSIPISFVGGISEQHVAATELLETLVRDTPMRCWGYGFESLPATSGLPARYQGAAWGLDMFSLLADSRITLNRHGEVARQYANNMRLFEATGCGALLLTDYRDNLNELFEIGREVIAFRSNEEASALASYYLAHPDEAAEIAEAGRQRTLRDHTYGLRMDRTAEILGCQLRHQDDRYRFAQVDYAKISCDKSDIDSSEVTEALTTAWQDPAIPARQRALTREELEAMYRGAPASVFTALTELVRPAVKDGTTVLEIGCATGYYKEVLSYLLDRRIQYTGADYSAPLIEMARDYYPEARFDVADGANLPYEARAFEIVISGGVLLHVDNYLDHIAEAARVADRRLVAHRTPVRRKGPTRRLRKLAYGVETLELVFAEDEILAAFAAAGWSESGRTVLSADPARDEYVISYAFHRTDGS